MNTERPVMNTHKPVSLNLNVRGMGLSATLAIKERCRALRRAGRTVYDLVLGQSPQTAIGGLQPAGVIPILRLARMLEPCGPWGTGAAQADKIAT